jgi:hypothetical protein
MVEEENDVPYKVADAAAALVQSRPSKSER